MEKKRKIENKVPFLPLRDIVVFPYMIIPLLVGRENSIKAIEKAMNEDRMILLVTQKNARIEDPGENDLYMVGTLAEILQMLKLPDGTYKVLVEGLMRVKIEKFNFSSEFLNAKVSVIKPKYKRVGIEIKALMRNIVEQFEAYIKLNKRVPMEIMMAINNTEEPGRLADIVTAHLLINVKIKQEILESVDIKERLEKLAVILTNEIEILNVEKKIQNRVRKQLDKMQKEYYLREQLKAIRKELGETEEIGAEIDEIRDKMKKLKLSPEAKERIEEELKKMSHMQIGNPEYSVSRNYIDWILSLPWGKKSKDTENLSDSIKILEGDHYGLEDVKEKIIEYLAVRKLSKKVKGSILCFIGPPGVGKTSLGRSIAHALGRKFARFSLGGIRDEAEIRGHRRTYIGALPGKIIQLLKQTGTSNPVILLDEIDKMASDFRGDPASALLEVLDPEQNNSFVDNYLSIPFDLSDIMFITTANMDYTIPPALFDRMEVVYLSGYTNLEKYHIATKYLIPRQIKNNGLSNRKIRFEKEAIMGIIKRYTKEAGVRELERKIQTVCRKVARKIVEGKANKLPVVIKKGNIEKYLGNKYYLEERIHNKDEIGIVNGLAWTPVGGTLLPVEILIVPGKGNLNLTGQLGDVMKESAQAALTYVRYLAPKWKIKPEFFEEHDIHIHVPEGMVQKEGPSAGITIATALASAIRELEVRHDIAMTGEITLRGRVLPIGGLKEKLLAAYQADIKEVIIPEGNRKDLKDVPDEVKSALKIRFVKKVDQVFRYALKK